MAITVHDIGDSSELRTLVSQTDIDDKPVSIKVDQQRKLKVQQKSRTREELVVRCQDVNNRRVAVVLHLPYKTEATASATIVSF